MAFKTMRLAAVASLAVAVTGCGVRSPLGSFLPQSSEIQSTPSQAEAQAKFGTLNRDGAEQRQRALGEIARSR
jgi:predicted small lipoprotein YifL